MLSPPQPSIVSCAVNVVCELARKKPSNYLALAPDLFALLTGSTNNWMLIKVAKLLGALVQEEPRLARKLLEPLATIVQSTPAKSLMYEAIASICLALLHTKRPDGTDAKNAPAVVRLCTDRLREMVRTLQSLPAYEYTSLWSRLPAPSPHGCRSATLTRISSTSASRACRPLCAPTRASWRNTARCVSGRSTLAPADERSAHSGSAPATPLDPRPYASIHARSSYWSASSTRTSPSACARSTS